jgi:hypothetical protein
VKTRQESQPTNLADAVRMRGVKAIDVKMNPNHNCAEKE